MLKKCVCFITAVCMVLTFSNGCATIVSGRTQRVPVITNPTGAIVTVGIQKQLSPSTFILDKSQDYVIRVEKEGYETLEIPLRKTISGWVFGNILFGLIGGPIGIVIDISSGSATKFLPSPVEVNLIKQQVGAMNLNGKTLLFVKLIETKP